MRLRPRLLASLLVIFFLLGSITSCVNLEPRTKEGATVGAVAGGVLGVLFDKSNRWRGAVLGAALGAVIGGTTAAIMNRASWEAATTRKPVEYVSEDKAQRVYAIPSGSSGRCEWITVQYYEYGKLIKEEKKLVCPERS